MAALSHEWRRIAADVATAFVEAIFPQAKIARLERVIESLRTCTRLTDEGRAQLATEPDNGMGRGKSLEGPKLETASDPIWTINPPLGRNQQIAGGSANGRREG